VPTRHLGIDPGIHGAIALLIRDPDGAVHLHQIDPMPTSTEVLASGKTRLRVDAVRLAEIIRSSGAETAVLEKVGPRPGQGLVSSWALCRATTLVEGVCAALGIPYYSNRAPQVWRAAVGLPRSLPSLKQAQLRARPGSLECRDHRPGDKLCFPMHQQNVDAYSACAEV
jgi:crossover junction endodeoxyribonuclease RuvC